MSVARETKIRSEIAQDENAMDTTDLETLVDHVVNFNMYGLHNVETTLFFPWMKQQFDAIETQRVKHSFLVILDDIIQHQKTAYSMGNSLVSLYPEILTGRD